jgi:hypothetical protein
VGATFLNAAGALRSGGERGHLVRPLAGINTIEQAGNAIADLGLGMIVPPAGRIYASLVKGRLTWPDPSELAQSDAAMKGLWVESAHMVGLPEQA